jgi:cell wall-associated NlpC family hydrolase
VAKKPDPFLTAAQQQVNLTLSPQLDAIKAEQARADAEARNKALSTLAAYQAAATMQEPLAGKIGAVYKGAADSQAAYGKGYSDTMQQLLNSNADQSNSLLAQNNSPQHITAPNQGDVVYNLGGASPANVLATSGAGFQAAALMAPDATRGVGLQGYQQALNDGTANNQKYLDAIQNLEAQRPGLLNQALSGLHSSALASQQNAFDQWYKQQQLGLDKNRLTLDQSKANQPNFFGSATGGYYAFDPASGKIQNVIKGTGPAPKAPQIVGTDKTGRYIWDKNTGTFTPLPGRLGAPAAAATAKSFSFKDQANYRTIASESAKDAFYGTKYDPADAKLIAQGKLDPSKARVITGPGVAKIKGDWLTEPQHYQQVMADLLYHVPLAFAQQALNRFWKKPGYDFDVEQRKLGQFVPARATKGLGRPLNPKSPPNQGKASAAAETAASQKALAVVTLAKEALGTPYVWGGTSPSGFDCSGLLQYAWGKQGVSIPRTTYDQWTAGRAVAKNQLQPGDAVFFTGSDPKGGKPGHVGMYVGSGQFIEAPKTGSNVRVSTLAGRRDYVGARRYA